MSTNTIMADAISGASIANGVVRLELGQQGPDGKPFTSGQLVFPLVMLPAITQQLVDLTKQVDSRHREMMAAQAAAGNAPPAQEPAQIETGQGVNPGGAFRFG